MFKNIYTKFVVTYITLLISIIFLISLFTLGFFYKQYSDQTQVQSLATADKIDSLLKSYYNNEITKTELVAWIDAMSYISNTKIYVLNPDKTVINNMEQQEQIFKNESIVNDIKKVISGEKVIKIGLFGNKMENNIMYVGQPFIYENKIVAVILLFTPVDQFVFTIENIIYSTVATSILATIIGSFVILYVSKNISKPITDISNYAKLIGRGNDVPDLEVIGQDEIAKLTISFNEMKKEIKATENIRKEFVANVSHELRTPLTTIIGFLKGILDGVIGQENQMKYLQIVYDEANRLKGLTTEILDTTKMEAGKVMLNKTKFNLTQLLDDIYVEFNTEFENKGIVFLTEYKKNIMMTADRDRIKQVIINIISNALKFTHKGYIKLSARVNENKILLIIEDSGDGIPKEKLPYVFDKFYTANEYGSATGGAGLGLNIVKSIVKMHEGNITIESEVGSGTRVTVEI